MALILRVLHNHKHRTMLSLIYSCGLRRGELLELKPSDVDSKRGLLIIRQGKGRKRQSCTFIRENDFNVAGIL